VKWEAVLAECTSGFVAKVESSILSTGTCGSYSGEVKE
jgi:hypothetical protein